MSDQLIAAIYGGLLGALITGGVAWFVGGRARQYNYYSTLVKLMGEHNWSCLAHDISAGLPVTQVDEKTQVVCYQHINLLLYVWIHKDIIQKDESFEGWRRWARSIIAGAKLPGNEKFGYAYHDILEHGDLYPRDFRNWLKNEMRFSATSFQGLPPSVPETKEG